MMMKYMSGAALAVALAGPAVAAPVELVTKVMSEQRTTANDGSTRVALEPVARVTPGDRLVYQISYHNNGPQPVANFVLTNPLPAGIEFVASAGDSATPDMSIDGREFGPLTTLRVRTAAGSRAALASDVKVVRWRMARPLAPGARGQVSFRAVLR